MAEVFDLSVPRATEAPVELMRTPPPIQVETQAPLTERAVLLQLSISAWGVDRKLKPHQYEVDANKEMTRAGKKVLVSPELKKIHQLDSACREWVASKSLPSTFRRGTYLQPLANLLEVDEYLVSYISRRGPLVEEFLAAYPGRREEARFELRSLYDPHNYPCVERLRERFSVRHEYLELVTAPESLSAISAEMFQREQKKIQEHWQEALDEARTVLRSQLAGLVEHMVERLEPGENGKPRVFRDSLVGNMEEWLLSFSARNLADDRELAELVQKAREVLHPRSHPVTAEALRSDAGLRQHLQEKFATIKQQLDGLVTDRPSRRIRLEE